MITINPKEIQGDWKEGFVLDVHTISSQLIGYNEYGHEIFDTKRSEIGELLYKLKYKGDKTVVSEIVEIVVDFLLHRWKIGRNINGIIPVPPSNTTRIIQPVFEIANETCKILKIAFYKDSITKIKPTSELKNIYERDKRTEILKDVFKADVSQIKGKAVLLFDDLYRSGATINTITNVLYKQGKAKDVYALSLTKTRSIS